MHFLQARALPSPIGSVYAFQGYSEITALYRQFVAHAQDNDCVNNESEPLALQGAGGGGEGALCALPSRGRCPSLLAGGADRYNNTNSNLL